MRTLAILTAFIIGMNSSYAAADIAPLFSMKGATCGTLADWKDTVLSYGEDVGLKDVRASVLEEDNDDRKVIETIKFTITNNSSSAIPSTPSWTVFSLVDGALMLSGSTFLKQTVLLRPGDNSLKDEPMTLAVYSGQFVICLTLEF